MQKFANIAIKSIQIIQMINAGSSRQMQPLNQQVGLLPRVLDEAQGPQYQQR
jgi:hypothetical protein